MMLRRMVAFASLAVLAAYDPLVLWAQQAPVQQSPQAIRATTELVLVNVVARDKKGNLIRDLKREDFTVFEDGQKQQVSSFDFENIDELALAQRTMATATGTEAATPGAAPAVKPQAMLDARDRRLILLFFDFSAMEVDQIDHSVDAAKKYVNAKMQPADVKRIHDAFATAFATPEVSEAMAKQGNTIDVSTTEYANAFFRSELAKYAKLVKKAGLELQ